MRLYLKEVDEKLKLRETKVKEQKKVVDAAEKKVEDARQEMLKRQQDMEKMRLHRKEWEKEIKIILEQKEAIEMDETGSACTQEGKLKKAAIVITSLYFKENYMADFDTSLQTCPS
jgi:predicted  nucleic acid-binding Zn-ribbon protein